MTVFCTLSLCITMSGASPTSERVILDQPKSAIKVCLMNVSSATRHLI